MFNYCIFDFNLAFDNLSHRTADRKEHSKSVWLIMAAQKKVFHDKHAGGPTINFIS